MSLVLRVVPDEKYQELLGIKVEPPEERKREKIEWTLFESRFKWMPEKKTKKK